MAGLLLENGVLRVGTRAILEGVSPRFELETVRDDRVRSDCTGELVRDLDPTHVGVLSLGENANGPSGAHRADPIARHVVQIASRLPTTSRFVANARCKLWWMTPTWGGSECGSIPPETQFLLLEIRGGEGRGGGATGRADASAPTEKKTSGRRKKEKKEKPGTAYVAFLPLISADGFRATLSGHKMDAKTAREQSGAGGDGRPLCLVAESGDAATTCSKADSILCVAVASSPFEAAEAVVAAASRRTQTFGLRVDKVVPPTTEVFGWCTWDAFYHSVTPAGVEAGVASLASGGTPARFVIVDDGWQSVTPDAAYRKKVDHISDHPPGSPFRSSDAAPALARSASLPATPSKSDLFQTTETERPSVLRSVDAFGVSGGRSSPGAPENASPAPSSRSSPARDDVFDAYGQTPTNKMTRLARVTRSAANPLRRENFSRAKSRLKQSVSHLASTEVHRGNDRIENAMATALVAAQAAAKQAHIPVPSEPAKAWWPMRAAALVATGMASGLESAYWHGVHSSPYLGLSWRWFKFLGQGVLSPAIRAAVSTLSCFNHRVSLIEANVKFANSETQLDTPYGRRSGSDKSRGATVSPTSWLASKVWASSTCTAGTLCSGTGGVCTPTPMK
jgi:hypothetical protein